jgi:hypothetical protein
LWNCGYRNQTHDEESEKYCFVHFAMNG